ncbi:MAG: CdaR family protein [Trichococcus flocculiformis]
MRKQQDDKFLENKWVVRGLSFLISLLLFTYVYSENYGWSTSTSNSSISTSKRETISNVPIQVNIDTDEYFISGLPETVVLTLNGPESVLVQTISAADYRIVTENLDELGPGTHTIQLTAENLSNEIDYAITPSRVNVVIEERVAIESPVEVRFDESLVDPKYLAGVPELSVDTVTLTGPASTISRVDSVYVTVAAENGLTNTVNMNTVVQVVDASGNKLNVSVDPQEISVRIPISLYGKKVPLVIQQTGVPLEGKVYTIDVDGEASVTLTGDKSILADIDEVFLPVSVTGVESNTTQTLTIPVVNDTLTATPTTIKVNIRVSNAAETPADSETTADEGESSSSADESSAVASSDSDNPKSEEGQSDSSSKIKNQTNPCKENK